MAEEDVVQWLYAGAQALLQGSPRMGDMEKALDRVSREVRRKALERLTQAAAALQCSSERLPVPASIRTGRFQCLA